jgi:hypothetical protein
MINYDQSCTSSSVLITNLARWFFSKMPDQAVPLPLKQVSGTVAMTNPGHERKWKGG